MTKDQMRTFTSAMLLKDLKAGDILSQREVDAVEHFLGSLLNKVREMKPQRLGSEHFTITEIKDGAANE